MLHGTIVLLGMTASTTPQPADLATRVRGVLDLIRPAVRADGGDIELVEIVDGEVRIRFQGACIGCPSSNLTLQMGIERNLRDRVPEVRRVIAVP